VAGNECAAPLSFKRHWFPPDVIRQAVRCRTQYARMMEANSPRVIPELNVSNLEESLTQLTPGITPVTVNLN